MTYRTAEDAKAWRCPVGRTFSPPLETCIAEECPCWRWRPLAHNDPRFTSAIQREILLLSGEKPQVDKNLLHKEAVEKVNRNPRDYMIPDGPEEGYCGLGSVPITRAAPSLQSKMDQARGEGAS